MTVKYTTIAVDEHNPEMGQWPPSIEFYVVPTKLLKDCVHHCRGQQMSDELNAATQGESIATLPFYNSLYDYWLENTQEGLDKDTIMDDEDAAIANVYQWVHKHGDGVHVFVRYL